MAQVYNAGVFAPASSAQAPVFPVLLHDSEHTG